VWEHGSRLGTQASSIFDPDYPDYGYPPFEGRVAVEAYIRHVQARAATGGRVERLRVGSDDQIGHLPIKIRAVAGRGIVWTGEGSRVRAVFPPRTELAPADFPNENAACCAVLLRYGRFSAFFAGDLTDWADGGARPWMVTDHSDEADRILHLSPTIATH
jgi:hypothetical protein